MAQPLWLLLMTGCVPGCRNGAKAAQPVQSVAGCEEKRAWTWQHHQRPAVLQQMHLHPHLHTPCACLSIPCQEQTTCMFSLAPANQCTAPANCDDTNTDQLVPPVSTYNLSPLLMHKQVVMCLMTESPEKAGGQHAAERTQVIADW